MSFSKKSFVERLCSTVPASMKEEVHDKLQQIKRTEEEKLRKLNLTYDLASKQAIFITLSRLMMDIWSPRMRRRVEKLMLAKCIELNYLKSTDIQYVFVFDPKEEEMDQTDWVVEDQDESIVNIVWEMFNMKDHFLQVDTHRSWIKRSYERLKDLIPSLTVAIIERHDLSKYSFSQAVGYTLKFQQKVDHNIWTNACDQHLHNEPHHYQLWSNRYTPEQKQKKLEVWMMAGCDFSSGVENPYGINLKTIDFASGDLAMAFLMESFIDKVAVEWERNKGQELDISNGQLVYIEDRFLSHYSNDQYNYIKKFMMQIIDSNPIPDEQVSEREKMLLSTVRDDNKEQVKNFMIKQKKIKLGQFRNQNTATDDKSKTDIQKRVSDEVYNITLACVVMEDWDKGFRDEVEKLVLKKAIEVGYIKESHLEWITVFDKKDSVQSLATSGKKDSVPATGTNVKKDSDPSAGTSTSHISSPPDINNDLVKMIWEEFDMRTHFQQMADHRGWLMKTYQKMHQYVPEVPEEVIERHDLSKFAFSQAIGYTLKWVHNISHPLWSKACDNHLHNEPHHPQMWSNVHSPARKKSCLESWLCVQAGGAKYGVQVSTLCLASENMATVFLYESFLDMVAIEWERKKEGRLDLTHSELVAMDHKYLQRYTQYDRKIIVAFMEEIRTSEENPNEP